MRKLRVQVTFEVDVEVPDDRTDADAKFDIEENHCPGTGIVGAAVEQAIERCQDPHSVWYCACWGCPGENRIIRGLSGQEPA